MPDTKPPRRSSLKKPPPEDDGLQIHGGQLSDFAVIPSSTLALLCGIGQSEGKTVLVPYVQLRLLEPEGEIDPTLDSFPVTELVQMTLGFENAAFLIMDMARDFRAVSRHLVATASGDLKPPPGRIAYTLDCLQKARTAIDGAAEALSALTPSPAEPPSRPQSRLKRPVTKVVTASTRKPLPKLG